MLRSLPFLRLVVAVATFAGAGTLRAGVVYSNFGDNSGYSAGAGLIVMNDGQAYASVAAGFVPAGNYSLNSIELVVTDLIPNYGSDVTVGIFADSGGQPGGPALESFTLSGLLTSFGQSAPVLTINSLLHPVLLANTEYWVGLNGPVGGMAVWNQNVSGATGFSATDSAGKWTASNEAQGVLEVDGTLIPDALAASGGQQSAPEPGSVGLLLAGLLAAYCGASFAHKKKRTRDEGGHGSGSV